MRYDIYSNARGDAWRFTLGRGGDRTLLVVGLNPSTATQDEPDPTVARVEEIATRKGFDGFIMMNLYPVRATQYETLPFTADAEAMRLNVSAIESVIAQETAPQIWAAWGDPIMSRSYFGAAIQAIEERTRHLGGRWLKYGSMTNMGNPRHPSRAGYEWAFTDFDLDQYLVDRNFR